MEKNINDVFKLQSIRKLLEYLYDNIVLILLFGENMELKINIIEGRPKNSKGKYVLRKDPMDAVHNPDQRHWIGPKLNLKEYFQNFDELIVESRDYVDFKSNKLSQDGKTLRKLVEADGAHEISDELFQETFECCDIDKFT